MIFREQIKEHRLGRDPNHPRDFMDAYLEEVGKKDSLGFHQESMELTILDLFKVHTSDFRDESTSIISSQTGAATTATTLLWIVLHLTRQQVVGVVTQDSVVV